MKAFLAQDFQSKPQILCNTKWEREGQQQQQQKKSRSGCPCKKKQIYIYKLFHFCFLFALKVSNFALGAPQIKFSSTVQAQAINQRTFLASQVFCFCFCFLNGNRCANLMAADLSVDFFKKNRVEWILFIVFLMEI